jgi:hypothetical protein
VLSGYLGSAEQGEQILEIVRQVKAANPDAWYFCWHHRAGPVTILRMVGKLYGVQRPDVRAHAAHRKLGTLFLVMPVTRLPSFRCAAWARTSGR